MYDRSLTWMQGLEIDEGTRLRVWQERRDRSDSEYSALEAEMDIRERKYNGDNKLTPLVAGDTKKDGSGKKTSHVRNITFENIESMVSTNLPTPKVTAKHKEDEKLAAIIEHWLRNEMDRLPFETMNDMAERTVPMQGGAGWHVEWDERKRTHTTVGEIKVTLLHPKMLAPQPGVFTGIQDMDWLIIKVPTTKGRILREYGIDVYNLGEEEPELRSSDGVSSRDEMLTMYIGYEKNEDGGIDRFVWVNDTVLENIENYQARHQEVCRSCHRRRPAPGQIISNAVVIEEPELTDEIPEEAADGARGVAMELARQLMNDTAGAEEEGPGLGVPPAAPQRVLLGGIDIRAGEPAKPVKYTGGPCPWCGAEDWTDAESEYEEVMLPIRTEQGTEIPGADYALDEEGKPILRPTLIPYYKPDLIPIVLQRNVSVYGQLLGNSDVDAIGYQQNTVNRLSKKVIDRMMKAGTRITMPPDASYRLDTEDSEVIHLKNVADRQYIATYDFSGNVEQELAYMSMVYEEARQTLGITNSYQGREDRTATSGVAKEFQAAQSAGRLESKRVMKAAAYASLFEMMFKFQLAYSDEPRSVSYKDHKGKTVYEEFNRYDFLKQDSEGAWYWNDDFLFSVDSNASLEANRTAMWQETRMNLQTGAFGNPAELETLILFWAKMEELHYPGAGATRKYLEERLEEQRAAMQQMQQMQMMQAAAQQGGAPPEEEGPTGPEGEMPEEGPILGEEEPILGPEVPADDLNMADM
ncbi:MAG: hypothetical protein IKI35_05695 [Stomatobaculum sp.]|nr:hypothetical protein [Stomatobaculum sp.]